MPENCPLRKLRIPLVIFVCLALCGCTYKVDYHFLSSQHYTCNNMGNESKSCYQQRLKNYPHLHTVDPDTGVETFRWDSFVIYSDEEGSSRGDCTFEVRFDPQGQRLEHSWIGRGCLFSKEPFT